MSSNSSEFFSEVLGAFAQKEKQLDEYYSLDDTQKREKLKEHILKSEVKEGWYDKYKQQRRSFQRIKDSSFDLGLGNEGEIKRLEALLGAFQGLSEPQKEIYQQRQAGLREKEQGYMNDLNLQRADILEEIQAEYFLSSSKRAKISEPLAKHDEKAFSFALKSMSDEGLILSEQEFSGMTQNDISSHLTVWQQKLKEGYQSLGGSNRGFMERGVAVGISPEFDSKAAVADVENKRACFGSNVIRRLQRSPNGYKEMVSMLGHEVGHLYQSFVGNSLGHPLFREVSKMQFREERMAAILGGLEDNKLLGGNPLVTSLGGVAKFSGFYSWAERQSRHINAYAYGRMADSLGEINQEGAPRWAMKTSEVGWNEFEQRKHGGVEFD